MNSRKIVGVISLIFAWIFIRISHEGSSSTTLPFILSLIDYILFAFGVLQLVLGVVLEDIPHMKRFLDGHSKVSEN